MMHTQTKTTELKLTRTIAATPAEVFDVWLDSKSPGSPWFSLTKLILNPVENGLFYHAVEHAGHEWAHYGRFIAIDRPHRIQHTWMSEATRGLESVVTLTFEAQGADTLLVLHHTNVPDDEMGRQHEMGWGFVLGAIVQRFAKGK
jgi:uncharacterized protein YndB with AHSA1/START domain